MLATIHLARKKTIDKILKGRASIASAAGITIKVDVRLH